jgi:protein phosphatase PTC1
VSDAQEASKILVDHALARFSTDNLSCMVIRLDADRHREFANRTADPAAVDGTLAAKSGSGISEADKIVEGARRSMARAGIADESETLTKVHEEAEENLDKSSGEGPGSELSVSPNTPAPVLKQPSKPDSSNGS